MLRPQGNQGERDATEIARARLLGAGLGNEIPSLIERAAQIVEALDQLAALDPELPEPALIFEPIVTPPAEEAR